jgi:hypothetical protein
MKAAGHSQQIIGRKSQAKYSRISVNACGPVAFAFKEGSIIKVLAGLFRAEA